MIQICPDRKLVRWAKSSIKSVRPKPLCKWYSLIAVAVAGAVVPATVQASDRNIRFELGLGAQYTPAYEGSDEYQIQPSGTAVLNSLSFGSINFGKNEKLSGFSVAPSFRYVAARKSADYPILDGIPDNEATIELGLKARYHWDRYNVFAAVRKGIGGHRGTVGELGAEAKFQVSDQTSLTLGSIASFGDSRAMSFAFDVPATAINLSPYDAGGGLKSVGLAAEVRHRLTDRTALVGRLGWDRLVGDAASSPIVSAGSKNQLSLGFMLVRKFNLRF